MRLIRKIDFKLAARILIIFSVCVVLFHLLVLSGLVPFENAWGGRLQDQQQMYIFESVSLLVNIAVIVIIATKAGYIKSFLPDSLVSILLWILVILFSLNTIGNIFSKTWFETLLFTPITFSCAILFYRMAIEKTPSTSHS